MARNYPKLSYTTSPDVPYYVNRALDAIAEDVTGVENKMSQRISTLATAETINETMNAGLATIRADADRYAATLKPQLYEAPAPGVWIVGTDWRGQDKSQPPATHLHEAPEAGLWYVGTDWRGLLIAAEAEAPIVDPAASSAGARVATPDGLRPWTSDPTRLVSWGDSLTQGYPRPPFTSETAWPGVLDASWPGTVHNGGVQGQTAEQIALRQGGLVLTTTEPVTVPGDGSKVSIRLAGASLGAAFAYDFSGTLGGRPVVLSHSVTDGTATSWTVRLSQAGEPVTIPAGATFDSGAAAHADAVTVIAAGRNDLIGLTAANVEQRITRVIAATEMMVARLTPLRARFLVIGTITSTSERRGSLAHDTVTAINAALAELYPLQWWSLQSYLSGAALADSGIAPTQADRDALEGGTYPPSLSHDGLHFTTQAAALIAQQIQTQLTNRRYLA